MLESLGINGTFFVQMGIFIFTLIFLSQFVFKPYYQAYRKRKEIMDPEEDLYLKNLKEEIKKRKNIYEGKVRGLNQECQSFYTQLQKEALLERETLLTKVSKESQQRVESFKKALHHEWEGYLKNLENQSEEISELIAKKVLHSGEGKKEAF